MRHEVYLGKVSDADLKPAGHYQAQEIVCKWHMGKSFLALVLASRAFHYRVGVLMTRLLQLTVEEFTPRQTL